MAKIGSPSCSAPCLWHAVGATASQAHKVPREPSGRDRLGGQRAVLLLIFHAQHYSHMLPAGLTALHYEWKIERVFSVSKCNFLCILK